MHVLVIVFLLTLASQALTITRVYSDRADRLQYKTIFDELQRATLRLTGQPLRLKRLSKDGTLISVGVDMELAQALGAGDSFLPTNDAEFSGIHVQTAEEIIEYFVRGCYTHAKRSVNPCISMNILLRFVFGRGVHDLKPHVTDDQYRCLVDFMYLETKQEVDEFAAWVKTLGNTKVQGACLVSSRTSITGITFFFFSMVGP
jgi:hypothetical protein